MPLKACLRHGRPFKADIYSYPPAGWYDIMTFLLYIYIIYIIRVRVYGTAGFYHRPYFKKRIFKSFFFSPRNCHMSYTYIIYFMGSRRFYRSLSRHACGMGDPLKRIYIIIASVWCFLFSYFPFFL